MGVEEYASECYCAGQGGEVKESSDAQIGDAPVFLEFELEHSLVLFFLFVYFFFVFVFDLTYLQIFKELAYNSEQTILVFYFDYYSFPLHFPPSTS